MRNSILALGVGLVCGLLVTWYFFRSRSIEEVSSMLSSSSATARSAEDPEIEDRGDSARLGNPGVTVHVVRAGRQLEGAAVSIFVRTPSAWVPVGRERTDGEGNAHFPGRPGRYALRAVAPDGASTMAIENVAWTSSPLTLELAFKPPERVWGVVVDRQTHAPVPQATVVWVPGEKEVNLPPEFALPGQADAFGRFVLEVPPKLQAVLDASAPSYAHAQVWVDQTGSLHSQKWSDKAGQTVELTHGATVAGVVVDEEGHAVANAIVTARPEEDVAHSTDAEGRFQLQVQPEGATVHALSPKGPQALQRVLLKAGERRGDLRLVVSAGSVLEGLVQDQAQKPLAGAEVRVLAEPDDVELARVTTSAQGTFSAFAIPRGRYSIAAETAQHSVGRAVGVEHPDAGLVEVTVLTSISLEGTVKNAAGNPVANALVEISVGKFTGVTAVAHTDEQGHYLAADLQPGELHVRASLGTIADQQRLLYLPPGEAGHLDLVLGLTGRVKGHVTGESHRWSLFFTPLNHQDEGKNEVTDATGTFELALDPGPYLVFVASMHMGRNGGRQFEVVAGETTELELQGSGDEPESDGGDGFDEASIRQGPLGGGISFDNGPGGVRVDFLNQDSRMAKSGVLSGDVVVAIDGEVVRDSLDAFAKVKKPGPELSLTVRREGVERVLVVK